MEVEIADLVSNSTNFFLDESNLTEHWDTWIPLSPLLVGRCAATQSSGPHHRTRSIKPRHIEIQLLRDELAKLEAIRAVLSQRKRDSCTGGVLVNNLESKQVAKKQVQLLEHSMRSNVQLREEVATLSQVERKVRRYLRQQQADLGAQFLFSDCLNQHESSDENNGRKTIESLVHVELKSDIVRLYQQTGSVIESLRQNQDFTTAHVRDIRRSDLSGTLDFIDSRVVPFDHQATADAVWEYMICNRAITRNSSFQRVVHDETGTVNVSFSGEIRIGDRWVHCRVDQVYQRFEELDRVVFVTSTRVDRQAPLAGDQSVVICVNHWTVVSPIPRTQCCEIVCRDISEPCDRRMEVDFVQTGLQEYHDMMHVFVDSKLLGASLQGIPATA